MFEDLYKAGRGGLDLLGIGEAAFIGAGAMAQHAAKVPWLDSVAPSVLTGGADKVLGPLGYITSGIDLLSGGYNVAKGIDTGDGVTTTDGVHDLIGGTAGMLGNVPGPVGAVAKAFSGGFAIGDMIAPHVFGTEEEDNKPHMETIPEDGVFKPSTGNKYVDGALDIFGIRD
jgi:hypothetical protein